MIILLIILNVTAGVQGDESGLAGNDPEVPFAGGIGLLLAAGAVYSIKKIRQLKP